jgi:pSer/pThr/pTyr-binding forkhead associated (FHA) protein
MHATASWPRWLILAILLLPNPCLAQSGAVPLIIGAARTPQPDHLELLLELPSRTAALQPGEIQLLEDAEATAHATKIEAFRAAGWNVAVVLAVDTSGSMAKYLDPVKRALPGFVTGVPPNDAVALITFDDDVHDLARFETPKDQVKSLIPALHTAGRSTVLHKALDFSIRVLEQTPSGRTRRRTVVISDGSDESNGDPAITDGIIQHAVKAGVAVDTIWLGQPVAAKRNTLARFAERTGGIHRDAVTAGREAAEVTAALNDIGAIAANAVIASFVRHIDTSASTQEIGVSVARAGIGASSIALQVPRSAVTPPNQPPSRRDLVLRWTIRLSPSLPIAYLLVFLVAKIRNKSSELLRPQDWFRVIGIIVTPPPPLPPPPEAVRRQTLVAAEKPAAVPGTAPQGLALEAVDGPLRGQRIAVGPRFQIGAGNSNELRITNDKYLSGVHARIEQSGGQWLLSDQGSSNGTFLNGQRLTSGQARPLHHGESVRVGMSEFRVLITAPAVAGAGAANGIVRPPDDDRPR